MRSSEISKTSLLNGNIKENKDPIIKIEKDLLSSANLFSAKQREIADKIEEYFSLLEKQVSALENSAISWNYKVNELKATYKNMSEDLKNKLFLRSDTDNFYNVFSDTFDSNSGIATLNNVSHFPSLGSILLSAKGGQKKINANEYVLSISNAPDSPFYRIVPVDGSSLDSLKGDSENGWMGLVTSPVPISPSIVLTIKFLRKTPINHLVLKCENSNRNMLISALAIEDNQGKEVLEQSPLAYSNSINIAKEVNEIKILFKKTNFDLQNNDQTYTYIFDIKGLSLYGIGFQNEGTFVSKGYPTTSTKFAIEVCDTEPEGTSIEYYLQIKDFLSNEILTERVQPINKPPSDKPYGISIISDSFISNLKNPAPFETTVSSSSFINGANSITQVINGLGNFRCLNHKSKIKNDGLSLVKVFVNLKELGSKDLYEQKGGFLYTWVYTSQGTQPFNVGSSGIIILGAEQQGTSFVFKKSGWYQVKIPVSSYQDKGNITSLTELKELDNLFPYNGKYLIEGLSFDGTPYKGFQRQAKKQLRKEENLSLLDADSYHLYRLEDTSFACLINMSAQYKTGYIEYPYLSETGISISLMAKLKSRDGLYSPVLSSYKIKIGD